MLQAFNKEIEVIDNKYIICSLLECLDVEWFRGVLADQEENQQITNEPSENRKSNLLQKHYSLRSADQHDCNMRAIQ
jgi:hypothetical protein